MTAPDLEAISFIHDGAALMYWVRRGSDPSKWVLFVHGAGIDHHSFDAQHELFDTRYNLLLPDLRGQGRSGGSKPTLQTIIADLVAICARENASATTVLAHSFGSAVAQDLALLHPELVSRLVLISAYDQHRELGPQLFDRPRIALTRALLRVLPWPKLATLFARTTSRNETVVDYVRKCLVATGRDNWESLGLSAFAAMRTVEWTVPPPPTLVLRGELDNPKILAGLHTAMAARQADCQTLAIANAGHNPQQDAPCETNEAIRRFLWR